MCACSGSAMPCTCLCNNSKWCLPSLVCTVLLLMGATFKVSYFTKQKSLMNISVVLFTPFSFVSLDAHSVYTYYIHCTNKLTMLHTTTCKPAAEK